MANLDNPPISQGNQKILDGCLMSKRCTFRHRSVEAGSDEQLPNVSKPGSSATVLPTTLPLVRSAHMCVSHHRTRSVRLSHDGERDDVMTGPDTIHLAAW